MREGRAGENGNQRLRRDGFGPLLWMPGDLENWGTWGFFSSGCSRGHVHPLDPLTLMLQSRWFSEDISETCGEQRAVGGSGNSQRQPSPCWSKQLYKKGTVFFFLP